MVQAEISCTLPVLPVMGQVGLMSTCSWSDPGGFAHCLRLYGVVIVECPAQPPCGGLPIPVAA
jgi:hypothetical protein